jgi:hypothetical protein
MKNNHPIHNQLSFSSLKEHTGRSVDDKVSRINSSPSTKIRLWDSLREQWPASARMRGIWMLLRRAQDVESEDSMSRLIEPMNCVSQDEVPDPLLKFLIYY